MEEAARTITSPQLMAGVVVAVAMRVASSEQALKAATARLMAQTVMEDSIAAVVVEEWVAQHRHPLV